MPPATPDVHITAFLAFCRIECGFSPATLEAYSGDLRELKQWLTDRTTPNPADLNLPVIADHLRHLHERGLSESSIARHVATIRVFCRFLHATGVTPDDRAELLTQPSHWRPLPDIIGPAQVRDLLAAPQPTDPLYHRDLAILELLYAGGMRATELAQLDTDNLHLKLGVARVFGKGSKERIVSIGQPAIHATEQYLQQLRPRLTRPERPTERLLLSRTGRPITRVVVWQIVAKHARRAGLRNVHPHTLRHCFATHMLAGGADLRVVQELLGHANIKTTQVYTHVDSTRLKQVINEHHPRP